MEFPVWRNLLTPMLRSKRVIDLPLPNAYLSIFITRTVSTLSHTLHDEREEQDNNKFISTICDIVRQGSDWDTLSHRVDSTRLTHQHVDKVLLCLQLDSPKSFKDAKLALKFFHWAAHRQQIQHTLQSYSITIQLLIAANMFFHARPLLDALILEHPQARMFEDAMSTCRLMKNHGFVPTLRAWNTLLHVVEKSDQTAMVWEIYEEMLGVRIYPNKITVKILIDALCKQGTLEETIDLIDKIQRKRSPSTAVVNTALVRRVMERGRVEEGTMLLKRMAKKSLIPTIIAYGLIIYGHCKVGNLQQALDIHQQMVMKGLNASDFTYTALISGFCSKGRIEEARDLMLHMKEQGLKPYDLTYNSLIQGCCKVGGREEEAMKLEQEMLEKGFLPSVSVCNALICNLCKAGHAGTANRMLTILLDKDFTPNEVTYSNLIDGYCKEGKVEEVLKLYYEMEYRNLIPSPLTFGLIFRCLCTNQKFKEMEMLLKVMSLRGLMANGFVCRTVIEGLYETDKNNKALQQYDEFKNKGYVPDSHSFALLIKGLSSHSKLENVNELLNGMEEFVLKSSV
ncbi:hypothetical protein SUGI_0062570 [Cryptomeria japonica]|uniref:pentatricopeptide repeat-containing protein At1g66345, mitochondrial n=1 Tax=Cryptomeria japonica TaxID=3369 RepID=UPI00240896B6|nr:pentatricopeptide repeat-containing protein At1g66345, mitochondrial [Cryptomeria japonica]GLJ07241.1 hypothetical protein SUGI_0062570 [Cryptomeria japonica]